MGTSSGPNLVKTGLLFKWDQGNGKSWKGAAITNQYAVPTPDGSNNVTFSIQGTGTFKRIYSGTFDSYSITSNDVVYRYDLTATAGCYYHGNSVSITAGQSVTFTFDYYISPGAGSYPVVNFLANLEGVVSGSATDPTPTITGVWKTATITSTAGSSGSCNMYLYPGACNPSYLASSGFILYRNPQAFIGSASNFTAPFVGPSGVRSSTEVLLDLTKGTTITATNLTYASNNTFSFDGVDDYVSVSGSRTLTETTFSVWLKRNGTQTNFAGILFSRGTSVTGLDFYSTTNNLGYHWNDAASSYGFNSALTTPDGAWCLCVLTVTSTTATFYLCQSSGITTATNTVAHASTTLDALAIGRDAVGANNRYTNGSIAQASLYNRALTAAEVSQNFNATRGRFGI